MDIGEILLIIVMLIILTFVIYFACGIASSDWRVPVGMWVRFIFVAACATLLIPLLQGLAHGIGVDDLALMIAFIVIIFMIRFLIMPDLTVGDEWLTTIFASFLVVFIIYVIEKVAEALFHIELFAFV